MKKVDFISVNDDGREIDCTVTVHAGKVIVLAGDVLLPSKFRLDDGICVGRIIKPSEGDVFLESLCQAYNGSRFYATKPYDG